MGESRVMTALGACNSGLGARLTPSGKLAWFSDAYLNETKASSGRIPVRRFPVAGADARHLR